VIFLFSVLLLVAVVAGRHGDREANREDVHHCRRLREKEREGGDARRALADKKNLARGKRRGSCREMCPAFRGLVPVSERARHESTTDCGQKSNGKLSGGSKRGLKLRYCVESRDLVFAPRFAEDRTIVERNK